MSLERMLADQSLLRRSPPSSSRCLHLSEETTFIESLEGVQGKPRLKIHFPAGVGLFSHQQLLQALRLFPLHRQSVGGVAAGLLHLVESRHEFSAHIYNPCTAEKGYLDLRMEISTLGGHSSLPPPHTVCSPSMARFVPFANLDTGHRHACFCHHRA